MLLKCNEILKYAPRTQKKSKTYLKKYFNAASIKCCILRLDFTSDTKNFTVVNHDSNLHLRISIEACKVKYNVYKIRLAFEVFFFSFFQKESSQISSWPIPATQQRLNLSLKTQLGRARINSLIRKTEKEIINIKSLSADLIF